MEQLWEVKEPSSGEGLALHVGRFLGFCALCASHGYFWGDFSDTSLGSFEVEGKKKKSREGERGGGFQKRVAIVRPFLSFKKKNSPSTMQVKNATVKVAISGSLNQESSARVQLTAGNQTTPTGGV